MNKHPIEVFSDWVTSGKDDGMEKNHLESVIVNNFIILTFILSGQS